MYMNGLVIWWITIEASSSSVDVVIDDSAPSMLVAGTKENKSGLENVNMDNMVFKFIKWSMYIDFLAEPN